MLPFILSKINLLIFATAMAAILIYFSFSFSNVMVSERAFQIVKAISSSSTSLIESDSSCDSLMLPIPRFINIFSSFDVESENGILYLLKVQSLKLNDDTTKIVFAVIDKSTNKVLSADSFDTNSSVRLWDRENGNWIKETENGIILNPNSVARDERAVILIKEGLANPVLYIFPCPKEFKICEGYTLSEIDSSQASSGNTLEGMLRQDTEINNPNFKFQCSISQESLVSR